MKYEPTLNDRIVGDNLRNLRRRAGKTLQRVVDQSGVGFGDSTLSKVELGQRPLTMPEASALLTYFRSMTKRSIDPATFEMLPEEPATEEQWLGNDKPALFAVPDTAPDHIADETAYVRSRTLEINLDAPLSLADYRDQVWIPYLEHRYATDLKQTG